MTGGENFSFEQAVDAWREEVKASVADPQQLTHEQAIRTLAGEMLVTIGLLSPERLPSGGE